MKSIKKCSIAFFISASACFSCFGELGQAQDISFKSELDGTKQYYMEMLPADFDKNKKYDLIIGLHGHGSDRKQFAIQNRPECLSFRKFAAKHNMIVITPDYRAKTSWMGPAAEADLLQIIKEIKAKYKINKVFLVGASMGATSALTFAAIHPDMIDGVTAMNGHANHVEYNKFQDAISKSFGGTKDEVPSEYKKRSAEYYHKKLTMPIAFTIGCKDSIVPPGSVIRLADNLKNNKQKVMLIKRPLEGHATSFGDAMTAMEFMLTGIKPKKTVKINTVSEPSSVSAVKSEAQSGEGGIFFAEHKPKIKDAKGKYELGLKFYAEKSGKITDFCLYQAKSEKGPHTLRLWDTNGKLLLVVNASAVEMGGGGWVNIPLTEPFAILASTEYIVSYTCNKAYPASPNFFSSQVKKDGIIAISGLYSPRNLGKKAPDKTFKEMNYFIDIVFSCEN